MHKSGDGTVTRLKSQLKQINGTWYLVFEATEFSPYALVVQNTASYDESAGLPYYVNSDGKPVFIGFAANGKYIAPSGVMVLFKKNTKAFTDTGSHWAKDYIEFVAERELFNGTGDNKFSPDTGMTEEAYKEVTSKESLGLSDGTYLLTISLPSESSGIAGILRAGDTVDVYGYTDSGGTVAVNEALTCVKVYKVLNNKLVSLDDLDAKLKADSSKDSSDYDFAPAYVVFTVNEQQAKTLIGLEKDKSLHLTLRGTEVQPWPAVRCCGLLQYRAA